MKLTVDNLKVGSKVVIGKYGVNNDNPFPIVWIKATPNCDFISEKVLDYICFDEREDAYRDFEDNNGFFMSNIFQFLNCDDPVWYKPTHPKDCPPYGYKDHYGFLYHFNDYEIDSINVQKKKYNKLTIKSFIRLPKSEDILGDGRFDIFNHIGMRPKGTSDLISIGNRRGIKISGNSYVDFWLSDCDININKQRVFSRSSSIKDVNPSSRSGVRPILTLKKNTCVDIDTDGNFFIIKNEIKKQANSNKDIITYLGLAQP